MPHKGCADSQAEEKARFERQFAANGALSTTQRKHARRKINGIGADRRRRAV
jgi:hypothetical protein